MGICNSMETFCGCTEQDSQTSQHAENLIRKRNRLDSSELRSFHDAIASGNQALVMRMLQQNLNQNLINSKYNEQSPLTCAVINKQHKVLQYLLDQDASPDVRDGERGDTPLHIAVRSGDLDAVQILCTYNVDRTITNEYNETAMDIALERATDDTQHKSIAVYLNPQLNTIDTLIQDTSIASSHLSSEDNDSSLDEVAGDLLDDIEENLTIRSQNLKPLEGWLERKQHSPPYKWLKRWVVVHHPYLLWSERLMNVEVDHVDTKEKKRWNKCINVKAMKVESVPGDKNRRFKASVKGKEYMFRAKNKKTRDYWVENLVETIEFESECRMTGNKMRVSSKMQRILTSGH